METHRTDSKPRISVVIPTYNSAEHLPRCLESVRAQSFEDWEIIGVDGASEDDTVQLFEEAGAEDERVRFVSGPDAGVYDAMNKGVRLAHGDWILFLGSDDSFYSRDVLEKMAPHLSGDVDLVYGDVLLHGEVPWSTGNPVYDGEFDDAKMLRRNISHQCIFYRRDLFERFGGYSLRYRVWADWEFNARVFRRVRKKHVDVIVADFQAGGLSSTAEDTAFLEDLVVLFTRYFRLSPFHSFYKERIADVEMVVRRLKQHRDFLSLAYFGLIWAIHGHGRYSRIRRLLRGA